MGEFQESMRSLENSRIRAESIQDQYRAQYVEQLQGLIKNDPGLFRALHALMKLDCDVAAEKIERMTIRQRKTLLRWFVPAARLGLMRATFELQDKMYGPGIVDA